MMPLLRTTFAGHLARRFGSHSSERHLRQLHACWQRRHWNLEQVALARWTRDGT